MPNFYFDLVTNRSLQQQGSMILEDFRAALDRADQLAAELYVIRPELRGCGCAIRVTDDDGEELYRTPLDALPALESDRASLRIERARKVNSRRMPRPLLAQK